MATATESVWTDDLSVLFTSFYGWTPETWGCVNWSDDKGRSRRDNLLQELTDPFITVCYVTGNSSYFDPRAKGLITGFMLVGHEAGDRDEFTHPTHHGFEPAKWRHALRAVRAFSYLPEHRIKAVDLMPKLSTHGQPVATWGEVLEDGEQIIQLRAIPWEEVPVYQPRSEATGPISHTAAGLGFVQAGPAAASGYAVSASAQSLPRQLYVLRLEGDADAYLGRASNDRQIYKIGLSRSPERRRQAFQKSMPWGAFRWSVNRVSGADAKFGFSAAVAGEDAMKQLLAREAEHLGGEFYLADLSVINDAWESGCEVARKHEGEQPADV